MQMSSLILMTAISGNDERVGPMTYSLAPSYTAGFNVVYFYYANCENLFFYFQIRGEKYQ